ncbi:MAG TPA: hypothetical protein DCS93_08760 [Microscillaceae bacterium]|nr:hypothetical protein [Microscillaceae bacterium]
MNKTHKYYHWIIIVSAILIAVLFNWENYSRFFIFLQNSGKVKFRTGVYTQASFLIINTIGHFVLFNLLAFFNYTWKDLFIHNNWARGIQISLIVMGNFLIYILFGLLVGWTVNQYVVLQRSFSTYFLFANYAIAILAVAEAYFLILLHKVKTAEVAQLQLQEEKKHAELAALKEQISPHFFFNTLTSLSTIVRNEAKEVGLEFIQDLSRVYRYALASGQQDLVTLQEELEFINAYIFLVKKRFGEKLVYKAENLGSLHASKIPPMALQLLIENAIQHNIITQTLPLTIRLYTEADRLCVENNLQPRETADSLGIGLQNLANRYRLLTGKEIVIEKNECWFRVKLPIL